VFVGDRGGEVIESALSNAERDILKKASSVLEGGQSQEQMWQNSTRG